MPKKLLSAEEKMDIVYRCLKGEWSIREAERITGVNKTTIRQWITQYESEGVEAFVPHERNRVYSPEQKKQAIQDYLSGMGSFLNICKKYKIRDTHTLRNWAKPGWRIGAGSARRIRRPGQNWKKRRLRSSS